MRLVKGSVRRLSVLGCLTFAGLVGGGAASAQCAGTNTCYGTGALEANAGALTGNNSAFGYRALNGNTTGGANTAAGAAALELNVDGFENTALGNGSLNRNNHGSGNTAIGFSALFKNQSGDNTAVGRGALLENTSGAFNTAAGEGALRNSTTGYRNVAVGYQAGHAVTTGSDNILIGAGTQGSAAANGVIRIGSSAYQKRAFIAGIRGVKTGNSNATTVFIDSNGQLGTVKSSRRYKEDIQPMGSVSEQLFALRPVSFRYKEVDEDGRQPVQYGLIAEEVAEVFPEIVVYDADGQPETVSYHVLSTLLLNELQKEARRIAELERQVAELTAIVSERSK